jgi:hypothetical protein
VYEQPPARRRIGPALIVVLVLLAAGAGTGSYLVTRQILAGRAGPGGATAGPGGANAGPGGASASAGTPSASSTRTRSPAQPSAAIPTGPQTTPKVTPKPQDPGTSCPAITARAVADAGLNGELRLLRYVDASAAGTPGAEAWVCKNADGVLFYQGHRKSSRFEAATSNDTILLGRGIRGKVETEGDQGFVAVNPLDAANPDDPNHTEYHVSPTSFFYVTLPQADKTVYVITRTVP